MNIDTDHAEPNKPNKEIDNETHNSIDKQNKLNIEINKNLADYTKNKINKA